MPEKWEPFVKSKYDEHSKYINLLNTISFTYND